MEKIADRLDLINRAVGAVVLWLALAMVVLQFGIVLLRYVFGISYIFLGEGVIYIHAALFMLGAGYTLWAGGHVRVDIFYARLSPRGRAAVDIFGHLVLLAPSLIVLLFYSWPMVRRSWAIWEGAMSVGGIPASFLLKTLIPVFCVLLLIQGASALVRDVIRFRENRA